MPDSARLGHSGDSSEGAEKWDYDAEADSRQPVSHADLQAAWDAGEQYDFRVLITGDHPWSGHTGAIASPFPPFKDWWVVLLDNGEECGVDRQLMRRV
jgi:hypothetical protein